MTVGVRKRSKYGNTKCLYNGTSFDSIIERNRWIFLESCQAEGKINNLRRQVRVTLTAHGQPVCDLILDYWYTRNGREVPEDAKGGTATVTDAFRIKRKLFRAQTGHDINIVTKQSVTTLPD